MRRWVVALAASVVITATIGCGDDAQQTPTQQVAGTHPPATTQTPTAPPPPAPRPIGQRAVRFVRAYYALLNHRDFDAAWARLSEAMRSKLGPQSLWEDGYALTEGTEVAAASILAQTPTTTTVAVTLHSDDLDVCGDHVPQTFDSRWQLRLSGGELSPTAINNEKVAGGEPVRDPDQCPDYAPVHVPPDYSPPEGFFPAPDYSSPGVAPYEAPPDFCQVNSCIPNFPNGTGYPVQCADGEWSQSGGRQGACSWHGGVD